MAITVEQLRTSIRTHMDEGNPMQAARVMGIWIAYEPISFADEIHESKNLVQQITHPKFLAFVREGLIRYIEFWESINWVKEGTLSTVYQVMLFLAMFGEFIEEELYIEVDRIASVYVFGDYPVSGPFTPFNPENN